MRGQLADSVWTIGTFNAEQLADYENRAETVFLRAGVLIVCSSQSWFIRRQRGQGIAGPYTGLQDPIYHQSKRPYYWYVRSMYRLYNGIRRFSDLHTWGGSPKVCASLNILYIHFFIALVGRGNTWLSEDYILLWFTKEQTIRSPQCSLTKVSMSCQPPGWSVSPSGSHTRRSRTRRSMSW